MKEFVRRDELDGIVMNARIILMNLMKARDLTKMMPP